MGFAKTHGGRGSREASKSSPVHWEKKKKKEKRKKRVGLVTRRPWVLRRPMIVVGLVKHQDPLQLKLQKCTYV
jgi:hypothetical protein